MLFIDAQFNAFEFNEPGIGYAWELVLNPGVGEVVVATGTGLALPAEVMLPGQRYQLRQVVNGQASVLNFFSPNAVAYDALGG
jgi:hypothetical protein